MPANSRWDLIQAFKGLLSVLLTQYSSGDKIEENEMGGACNTYGGEKRLVRGFGAET